MLNEVRLFVRLIFTEVLRWVARSGGSLEAGVSWHAGKSQLDNVWHFLLPVTEDMLDRGVERARPRGSFSSPSEPLTKKQRVDDSAPDVSAS